MSCRKCGRHTPNRLCVSCRRARDAEEAAEQTLNEEIENGEIEEDDYV